MQTDLFQQPLNIIPAGTIHVHQKENNRESQTTLDYNKKKFSKKCMQLLVRLCAGERLRFADCVYTIGDVRRRSLDLIENDIPVQRTFISGSDIKEYWLNPEDIVWIKKKYDC